LYNFVFLGLQRERSFIETNFVETLKQPQLLVTPQAPSSRVMGSPASSSPAANAATIKMAERLEEKAANFATSQELVKAKDDIIDLTEKLETMKVKRAKDQDKIKEYEKIRIQHEQLVEFKVNCFSFNFPTPAPSKCPFCVHFTP
jgi:dynactin 1